jgi:hypothetical protein
MRPLHFFGIGVGIVIAVALVKNPLGASASKWEGLGITLGGAAGHVAGIVKDWTDRR